jgi:hypothetical protein
MADSQGIQTDTLSLGMQATLQQQSALMQQQNQITGTMLQSLERLQETMRVRVPFVVCRPPCTVFSTSRTERPPSDPPIQTEPPSAASDTAAALIPVVDLTATEEALF